jgi:hypothetical protein
VPTLARGRAFLPRTAGLTATALPPGAKPAQNFETTTDHALHVHGYVFCHSLKAASAIMALVGAVAIRARGIHSPQGHHNFVTAQLHRLREGRLLARFHIVGKAVHVRNRAMLLCNGRHLLGKLRVLVDLSLSDRYDEAVDILL